MTDSFSISGVLLVTLTVDVWLGDVTGVTDEVSLSSDIGVIALRLGVGSADGTAIGLTTFKRWTLLLMSLSKASKLDNGMNKV